MTSMDDVSRAIGGLEATLRGLNAWMETIDKKVDALNVHVNNSRAHGLNEIETRVGALEAHKNKLIGALAVISTIFSAAIAWIEVRR